MLAVVTGIILHLCNGTRLIGYCLTQDVLRSGARPMLILPVPTLQLLLFVSREPVYELQYHLNPLAVLFGFVYSLAYTPLQALYPAECLDYNTR